ncbi:MAG: hypothetical protein ACE5G9_03080 [Nitrospinales bacterium]
MIKKTSTIIFAALVLLAFSTLASANVSIVKPGGQTTCENASWVVYNLSEDSETSIQFDIGPYAYAWDKVWNRTLPPGGFQTNAIAVKSSISNKGPGDIQVNCQRKRFDSHDWKIDAGSGKTYQPNYHLDHVRPSTYIEPGLGLEPGYERGLFGTQGEKPEYKR